MIPRIKYDGPSRRCAYGDCRYEGGLVYLNHEIYFVVPKQKYLGSDKREFYHWFCYFWHLEFDK